MKSREGKGVDPTHSQLAVGLKREPTSSARDLSAVLLP